MVSLVLVRGVYKLGMGGAEHFPAGRGEGVNPWEGAEKACKSTDPKIDKSALIVIEIFVM